MDTFSTRRRLALCLPLVAAAVAGCGQVGENITKREVVVHFTPGTTLAQQVAVRDACGSLPHVTPLPIATSTLPSVRLTAVRFRVDKASPVELADLTKCLYGRPGVDGVGLPSAQ